MDIQTWDYRAKLVIIGDSGVGKTCFLLRYCESNFRFAHISTVGIAIIE